LTHRRIQRTGPLGATVVLALLFGSISAPLRSCVSHEGHTHQALLLVSEAETDAPATPASPVGHVGHTSHAGPDPDAPEPSHRPGTDAGCDCLGLCPLQDAPASALGIAGAQFWQLDHHAPAILRAEVDAPPGAPRTLPPARGPPSRA
jgi:hypothetical protein